jgi:aspartyl/asparaginyl beta-hydroxylase (cupin superfamily)
MTCAVPQMTKAEEIQEILEAWLPRIQGANEGFRSSVGLKKLKALTLAAHILAAPRLLRDKRNERPGLQLPWLPNWPGLTARPLHDPRDYSWSRVLTDASSDIRAELAAVCDDFERARYDSDHNEKAWQTYYFFLHGRPVPAHLAACPRTREALEQVPHNGFHVCFSALAPGGALHPHTGPTNASLTAHLGLRSCDETILNVGGKVASYRDNEVLVFDDSFVHWVDNNGEERRYTLMITFWHPELSAIEREVLHRVVQMGAR